MSTTMRTYLIKKAGKQRIKLLLASFLLVFGLLHGPEGRGQERAPFPMKLESLEFRGTERMSSEQLQEEVGLEKGDPLNDETVFEARRRLLGLGLFRSVILYLRRGSSPGLARLIIEVEDDENILGSWGVGSSIGITYSDTDQSATDPSTPPLGYRINLLGRNFFRSGHRASVLTDIDSEGIVREGRLAYGFPRFAVEDVQFDLEARAVDVRSRYLQAMGYGGRVQGVWTRSLGEAELQYGPAMYVNRKPRFAVPEFPKSTAGPKLGYIRETRLMGFLPSEGYSYSGAVLYSIFKSHESITELSGAYTFDFKKMVFATFELKVLTVGASGYSFRGENRYDILLESGYNQGAELFVSLKTGRDEYESANLSGSSGTVGLRYHSSGFIAELAFEITKSPDSFVNGDFETKGGGN